MALTKLIYSKDWTDKYDFPTIEESETQVRADMQFLFDEIAAYINSNLVDYDGSGTGPMSATQIPFKSSVSALAAKTTILTAIEYLYEQITEITEQHVADHSVTNAKLSRTSDTDGAAVDTDNIKANAVDLTTKVTGILPTANGGIGVDISTTEGKASARTALGIGSSATYNVVPLTNGGLGVAANTTAGKGTARENLGLGDVATEDVLPVSKGGTNATSAAAARTNLGLGSVAVENTVPVSEGGTGATTAANALTNLGAQAKILAVTTAEVSVTSSGVSVSCSGVTTSSNLIVTYNPSYFTAWQNGNVRCTGQGNGTITLTSDSTVTVKANVLIIN